MTEIGAPSGVERVTGIGVVKGASVTGPVIVTEVALLVAEAGAKAILVGETLMRSENIGIAIKELMGN